MSHYTTLKTAFKDVDALVEALAHVGFKTVEVHESPVNLMGFQGDVRADMANVVIRRRHVGRLSNDIGFRREPDGTYAAVISDYDQTAHGEPWLARLRQRYAYTVATGQLTAQGFEIVEETTAKSQVISIVARRLN